MRLLPAGRSRILEPRIAADWRKVEPAHPFAEIPRNRQTSPNIGRNHPRSGGCRRKSVKVVQKLAKFAKDWSNPPPTLPKLPRIGRMRPGINQMRPRTWPNSPKIGQIRARRSPHRPKQPIAGEIQIRAQRLSSRAPTRRFSPKIWVERRSEARECLPGPAYRSG